MIQNEAGYLIPNSERTIDKTSQLSRLKLNKVEFMSAEELKSIPTGSVFIFDVECYRNFFYVAFKCLLNGKYVAFEQSPAFVLNTEALSAIMWRFCVVGFNSRNYDVPIITLALQGATCDELKEATDFIIQGEDGKGNNPWAFEKKYKLKIQSYNHIDLIEVAPLKGSLKLYAGRLHCQTMQDLPFEPSHILTSEDAEIVRPYCCNDLQNTELLFNKLAPQLKLRTEMSERYGVELRSKSDAQIAEAVINAELQKVLGYYPKRAKIQDGTILQYNLPDFISFKSPHLNKAKDDILAARFELDKSGKPLWPKGLGELVKKKSGWAWELRTQIAKSFYKLGMGGLHSQENKVSYKADENTFLRDNDVESYYPRIILNQGLFPPHLGEAFLIVYDAIVSTRLDAKGKAAALKAIAVIEVAGFKEIADSLKVVINGSFGKLGNKWSTIYAPQLMLQVTITGQLALLMLIEMLEEAGIECVSGNTDGVVSMYPRDRHEEVRGIVSAWEAKTCFKTEETKYSSIYSRDVNNYIAIMEDGSAKKKGTYSEKGSALNSVLSKNPEHLVCTDAVIAFLKDGTSVETTVKGCMDIRRFVSVRNVKGGGEKDGLYLGKVVRWYYAKGELTPIRYVGSGNKVAKTDGAKPLMDLPTGLPDDVNYKWYIDKAVEMLYDCAGLRLPETPCFDFF